MKRWTVLPAVVGMCFVSLLPAGEQQAPPAKPRTLMQMKLDHAQQILEGLSLEDYGLIARHAKAMNELGLLEKSEHAASINYQTQLKVFRFANGELERLAKEKNLDGAALAYTQMTISCVNCHKIIRTLQAK